MVAGGTSIAFAMIVRGFSFDQLDGFAGLDDNSAKIKEDGDWETCDLLREARNVIERLARSAPAVLTESSI